LLDYSDTAMKGDKSTADAHASRQANRETGLAKDRPEWADGLRRLYDSVVDEPLPDSFRDLLDKLDHQG
jgi:hypothetical protein